MNRFDFKIKNVKLAFALLIIITLILLILYNIFIFNNLNIKNSFANQVLEVANKNENPVFGIQKINIFSSADAFNDQDNHSLQNMHISQYSDIAISINNSLSSTDMTAENTIKKLYIDNIKIENPSDFGTKVLNYKNPMSFSKYKDITSADRIDFKIVSTNAENESTNYDEPTFYADCSNPISLGFLNKDIITNYSVSEATNSVSFNGKVLQAAGLGLDKLNYSLVFTIHIVNNADQKFNYTMRLNVNLGEDDNNIYNIGYSNQTNTVSGSEYNFFRES